MLRRTLCLLALGAGAALSTAGAAEEEELVVSDHPALPGEVPAGSRADQLLWRDARDAMVEGNGTIRSANMARFDLHYAFLDLVQLGKDAAPGDAERLQAIRARLEVVAKALEAAIPRSSLGRCRYELLYFEQSMGADPSDELGARLPQKRAEAQRCRDDHRSVIATLGPAVRDVRAALDEVGPEIRERMARQHLTTTKPAEPPKDAATAPERPKGEGAVSL